jgi:hypothetical protein
MNAQTMTRHDLQAEIVQRSWEDNGFRKELIAYPAELSDSNLEKAAGGHSTILFISLTVSLPVADATLQYGGW